MDRIKKYIGEKITKSVVGRIIKYSFYTLVLTLPGPLIATIGVTGVAISAVTVHSGILEYGVSKIIF